MTSPTHAPAAQPSAPRHRPYLPCDGKRAAKILGLTLPAWDARRAAGTLWFEVGGGPDPVATGTRPKDRAAGALPLIGVAPMYLGVCVPGATWVYDELAVAACRHHPVYALALVAQSSTVLPSCVAQMLALLEDAP